MLWETYLLAQREIRRNVLRSSLTVLGIVIGVAAVITMVTLGSGATAKVTSDIAKLGTNMLFIARGQGFHGPGGARSNAPPFDMADVMAVENNILGLKAVAPTASNSVQVIYGNENQTTSATGTTNGFIAVRDWPIELGREFSDGEIRAGQAVCILGATIRKDLFGAEDPIDKRIRLNKITFRVVGVLSSKGQSSFGRDQDDLVLIPLRTLQRRFAGNTDIDSIIVSARDGVSTTKIQKNIEALFRERRRITPGKEDDFHVRDMKEIISTLTGTTKVLTALLGAVAAVSLLVGGIGIMNIMLVSVTERTREIGTRLAIGATESQVLMQFLVEAVVLSSFGGVCGIALGLGAAGLGARALDVPFVLNLSVVLAAFLFSGAVGVIFGYFPARQAAHLDPIDALRHE
jgi:putative ABC transport system permease protein